MNRFVVCLALALAFWFYRNGQPSVPVNPTPEPGPVPAVAIPGLAPFRAQMTGDDRRALSDCYEILSRGLRANPLDEPVIETTADLLRVHRAALLFVWRGVLGGRPDKYPGLREQLEGVVNGAVGTADVPLSAGIQQTVATAFEDISRSLR
jgi:hypothetical protein